MTSRPTNFLGIHMSPCTGSCYCLLGDSKKRRVRKLIALSRIVYFRGAEIWRKKKLQFHPPPPTLETFRMWNWRGGFWGWNSRRSINRPEVSFLGSGPKGRGGIGPENNGDPFIANKLWRWGHSLKYITRQKIFIGKAMTYLLTGPSLRIITCVPFQRNFDLSYEGFKRKLAVGLDSWPLPHPYRERGGVEN